METDTAQDWRRLTWLSYGNAYLSGHGPFNRWSWNAHLQGAVIQFRAMDTGELLATDGFEWLWRLKHQGVQRLSLQPLPNPLPDHQRIAHWSSQLVLAHSDGGVQAWAWGREANAMNLPNRRDGEDDAYVGASGPDIDTVWLLPDRFAHFANLAPATDWASLDRQCKAEFGGCNPGLESPWAAPETTAGWFFARGLWRRDDRDAPLPTVPATQGLQHCHRLLHALTALSSGFSNATHPRNEGNLYLTTDEAGAARIDAFAVWLAQWLTRVQCLAASDTRWAVPRLPNDLDETARADTPTTASATAISTTAPGDAQQAAAPANTPLTWQQWLIGAALLFGIGAFAWQFPKIVIGVAVALLVWRTIK